MENNGFGVKYSFVPAGFMINSGDEENLIYRMKNRFLLDTGNNLCCGVIDHHQIKKGIEINGRVYRSTTGIISVCPDLITENIDKNDMNIEIVTHKYPDFDCFASAYLVNELIHNGKFPSNYELLVEYTENINSGCIKIDYNQLNAPFLVACALDYIIDKSKSPDEKSDERVIARGVELIDYIMKRLDVMNEHSRSLYNPSLIPECSPFDEEVGFVRQDYSRYIDDVSNPDVCEKRQIRLPLKDTSQNYLRKVDALFWNSIPSCILHKFWARSDHNSPSGTGYIFTFIPIETGKSLFQNIELYKNRVIISVDPDSGVCLKELGKYLEIAETEKEEKLLGNLSEKRRTRKVIRYTDADWCKNANPWYDGSSHEYTIVDSPGGVCSLLSIDEIKNITLNFTNPKAKECFIRYIFYISCDADSYSIFCNNPSKYGCIKGRKDFRKERIEYFLPYIRKYLFGISQGSDKLPHSTHYNLDHDKTIIHDKMKNQIEIVNGTPDHCRYISLKVQDAYLTLFRYGVGFLIIDTRLDQKDIFIEDIIALSSEVDRNHKGIFKAFLETTENTFGFKMDSENMFSYVCLKLGEKIYHDEEMREVLYKVSNNIRWQDSYLAGNYPNRLSERMFLKQEDYISYGFSKSGCALAVTDCAEDYDNRDGKIKNYIDMFKTTDFDILLLALHQRNSLLNFSNKLSQFEAGNSEKIVKALRRSFLNFTTQSWFSQITEDELGMAKYRIWQDMFENSILYEEVDRQISEVDEYNRSQLSKRIEIISAITLPVVILTALLGVNVFSFTPIHIPIEYAGVFSALFLAAASATIYRFISNDK